MIKLAFLILILVFSSAFMLIENLRNKAKK